MKMLNLKDVSKSDEELYLKWLSDTGLKAFLSRLLPDNSGFDNYDKTKVCWFIIEESGLRIGSVWLERDFRDEDAVILGIFIAEKSLRSKGIGAKAIEEAVQVAKIRMPFKKVRLNVRKSNDGAIRCYEKCGFRICGEGCKKTPEGVISYYQMELVV